MGFKPVSEPSPRPSALPAVQASPLEHRAVPGEGWQEGCGVRGGGGTASASSKGRAGQSGCLHQPSHCTSRDFGATAPAEILGPFQGLWGRQLFLVAGLAFSQLDPGGCLSGSDGPWSGGSGWVSWTCGLLHTPQVGDRAAPAPLPGLVREG